MTRTSTIVWIASAVVVVGVGVGVAAAASSAEHGAGQAGSTASAHASTPASAATSTPGATSSASPGVSDPAVPAPAASSPVASPAPAPAKPITKPVAAVKTVAPHLTYYDFTAATSTLEVGGNVPGLVDAGGTCVVTATRGATTVSQSFASSPQASSTECGTMRLTSPKLTSGTWNLTIGYRSPRATGTSPTTEVTL